jgi:hypothetical protein
MGNLFTPLTNSPVVDWTDTAVGPDVPQSMLNALNSLERYTNVPVADAPTRETKIPVAQRYVGQVTYNVATDTFEYWNGTAWQTVNRGAAMPSTVNIAAALAIALTANQYYDYRATVNVTKSCIAALWVKALANVSVTPTTWQGLSLQMAHNTSISQVAAKTNQYFPSRNGGGNLDIGCFGRYVLDPGAHTVGLRATALTGSAPMTLTFVSVLLLRVSATPNAAAGTSAYGDW